MPDHRTHRRQTQQVRNRFDKVADTYDQSLQKFPYYGLDHMVRVFDAHTDAARRAQGFDMLDLGCGTGLCGGRFKPCARRLDGVDLSPKMLEAARRLAVYDDLRAADLHEHLAQAGPATYDLVTSAGVFVYLVDLLPVFKGCFSLLRPGGWFLFTIDRHDDPVADVRLRAGSDLMHTFRRGYLEDGLKASGFEVVCLEAMDDRLSWKDLTPIPAFVVLARKA